MMVFRGLARKLLLTHMALAVVLLVAGSAYVLEAMQRSYLRSLQIALEDQAVILGDRLGRVLAQGQTEQVQPRLEAMAEHMAVRVMVTDADGTVVGSTEPEDARLLGKPTDVVGLREALRGRVQRAADPRGQDLVYVELPIEWSGVPVGAVRLSYGLAELDAELNRFLRTLALGVLAAAGGSLLLSLLVAYSLTRSARRLARAAEALAGGDLRSRTGVTDRDEIGEAARAFDLMAERLQETEREREALFASISHEIHSTITGMGMALELLHRGTGLDADGQQLLVRGLRTHAYRLRRLADDLLQAARLARHQLALQVRPTSLSDLVREVAATFVPEASERAVQLDCAVDDELPLVDADPERLGQALGNLIENALRHTPTGRTVLVTAGRRDGACAVSVRDDGPGIPEDHLQTLFAPEARWPGALPGRLGLGLSIAKSFVDAHGGRLDVTTAIGAGTTFTILLPVSASEAASPATPPVS